MMKAIFSKYAKQELEDAAHSYELEYEGLGRRFKEEVKKAAIRIAQYPEAWSIERGEVSLLYSIEENHIFVVAVAHHIVSLIIGLKEKKHNKALKLGLSQSIDGPGSGFPDAREVAPGLALTNARFKIRPLCRVQFCDQRCVD